MSIQSQALILTIIILISVAFTKTDRASAPPTKETPIEELTAILPTGFYQGGLDFERASAFSGEAEDKKQPKRRWSVLDPKFSAEAIMVQSLETNFSFFNYQTYKMWPIASITKLVTVLVVMDEIGLNKKIPISTEAANAFGVRGSLRSGEIYTSRELVKMLLISSSNGAAVAFEDYIGSRERFVDLMNRKARQLGMNQTVFFDASGLSDLNQSSASDLMKLLKYIIEKKPEILAWTRTVEFLSKPINLQFAESRSVSNVNPLIYNSSFLGGKTGTLPQAKQNILSVMSFNGERVAVIILGSPNRLEEMDRIFDWIQKAYDF